MPNDVALRAALGQLLLPAEDRLALCQAASAAGAPPAFMLDEVMNALERRGYILRRQCAWKDIPKGAVVATRGDQRFFVIKVTFEGRAFLQMTN